MPAMKGIGEAGGSTAHHYQPASDYDDATLAQKREYWRTKKREQRARLSERRRKLKRDCEGEKLQHRNASSSSNSRVSNSKVVSPLPLRNESFKAGSPPFLSGQGEGRSQKEKWFQKMKLNKVLPQFPASTSRSAKEALANKATVKCLSTGGNVSRSITSPKNSGTPITKSSSVPPIRVKVQSSGTAPSQPQGRLTTINGDSSKLTPQLCVSMQGISVPKAQRKAQLVVRIQAKPVTTNVTPGIVLVSSPSASVPFKVVGRAANTTPQVEKKCALVNTPGAKGIGTTQHTPQSEEERAAKRREQWRIKKREQRAKLAAKLAKTREKTISTEQTLQRRKMQRTGQSGSVVLDQLPSPLSVKRASQRRCVSRVKNPLSSAGRSLKNTRAMGVYASTSMPQQSSVAVKEEIDHLNSGTGKLFTFSPNQNQQAVQIKVEDPQGAKTTQTAIATDVSVEKKSEQIRKLPIHIHFSNASRGISRCRMPRQRFIEAQKNFLSHRRNAPRIDPNETPEQTAARRREYWRLKKREQRAKLSAEVKAKLKEKDSTMRRVKRYQNILEEMRRAKAEACSTVTQPTGTTLIHASETIGGFIKEDGTVTINIPQVPSELYTKKEVDILPSVCNIITHPQDQPQTKAESANRNLVLGDTIRVNRPPPPLHLAQVKVSFPFANQSVKKPPRLLSIRPRTKPEGTTTTITNSHKLVAASPAQITLIHPQSLQGAISGVSMVTPSIGGCVMKMAVSSSAPSRAPPSLDPGRSEEDRMAKKREYWRIKKREQRAARAARLKQGVLQARGNAALQRRKLQKLIVPQQTTVTNCAENSNFPIQTINIQPHSSLLNCSLAITPQANEKKDEELTTADDLNSQPEQAICPDIKLSPSPPPPSEPDPALSADSQATTLLAVASMKKLLEESLSTVTECKNEHSGDITDHAPCKTEAKEFSEQEMKPDVALLSIRDEEKVPIPADMTLGIKSLQADADALVPASSPSPHLNSSHQTDEILTLLSSSSEGPLHSTSQHSSQAPSAGPTPSLPRRAQRLRAKKVSLQHCCPPESPKLHHLPLDQQNPQLLPGLSSEQKYQPLAQQQSKKNSSLLTQVQQRQTTAAAEQSGTSSLQKKREYWKLMKRQQRAKSKARQKESVCQGKYSLQMPSKTIQAPNLVIINTAKPAQGSSLPTKPAPQPNRPNATLTAVTSIPTVLVVSPTTSNAGQSPDTLQVKPPISSVSQSLAVEQSEMHVGPSQMTHGFGTTSHPVGADATASPIGNGVDGRLLLVEKQQEAMPALSFDHPRVRKWTLKMQESTDSDTAPSLPILTPPDNPLSSINLLPIEPLGQTPNCRATLSSMKLPCAQPRGPQNMQTTPIKLVPISTMVPPKPIPGESEEDFLKRKREYWRVKKKEQRARKAIRDKDLTQKRASNNWRLILPANGQLQGLETQDSDQWINASEESEQLMSTCSEAEGYFPYSSFTDEKADVPFTDYDDNDNEEGPISDAEWRNRYLMDHDPLNQLLVCMVCGDLQYSHSLEGVRAHIEEAHPETLNLDAMERNCILEAWDEQVSQRERFFTSQLQQHSGAPAEAHWT
ncbi:uncharacterized protein si:dkey-28a3.2 [Lampris incognitus]|uniref:uncharacterized protein si:dkey-28a3.2 n=1 Tax=Lampris incognitus TaxID=2546036 RepID=UPI0024B4DF19|nr:uncharacterized protein si:dkey-28a3.2 [Lampris incognitus]